MTDDPNVSAQAPQGTFANRITRLMREQGGAAAATFAIMLPVLIGFGALAIDVGVWSINSRQAQGAADQAAYSAAIASAAGTNAATEARAIAASMGFVDGADGVTVTVDNPPSSGVYSGVPTYWQVTIRQPQSLGLAAVFAAGAPTVVARAVAGTGGGGSCVVGLDTAGPAITFSNNTIFNQAQCNLYSASGISLLNNVQVTSSLYSAGAVTTRPNATVTGTQQPLPSGGLNNPYEDLTGTTPTSGACIGTQPVRNGGTLNPGKYCRGFTLGSSAVNKTINFNPGVYYIETQFSVASNFTFNSPSGGVTLIFNMAPSAVSIQNFNTFNITAPTSGTYSGVAFMSTRGDRTTGSKFSFGNGNTIAVQGAFYFPNAVLEMNNNLTATKCTQLVAWRVLLENNGAMKANCPGSGIQDFGSGTIALVE